VGEFDDDPPDDGDEVKDSGYTDAESVIDVEIVALTRTLRSWPTIPVPSPQKTRGHH
jgi:hypothetical protein